MEKVRFYDLDSGNVILIPASELAPGAVQAQVQGIEGIVWLLPHKLHQSDYQHPPFPESIRIYIRQIQAIFAEHFQRSFAEWEDGFRRDRNPDDEISIWMHAAEVYTEFVGSAEWSEAERKDAFMVIAACMTASKNTVWSVLSLNVLDREYAETIIDRYYEENT
jgi:hypothetical protein